MTYMTELANRFWHYVESEPGMVDTLDTCERKGDRPPVFAPQHAMRNVLCPPGASSATREALLATLPAQMHHLWFRSMSSSQALAQSVFGNLIAHGELALLEDMATDSGEPLIGATIKTGELEHVVDYLGEDKGRETNIDVLLQCAGRYRVAFECKLRETEIGACSRLNVKRRIRNKAKELVDNAHYDRDHCDGNYFVQHRRSQRCSLTGIGVKYWDHAPTLFDWPKEKDHRPCPLRKTYQLARNVMAVTVDQQKQLKPESGHVVLIYDSRNPAFQDGGKGKQSFDSTVSALDRLHADRKLLRRCSWQAIAQQLRETSSFRWLGDALNAKYGF